MSHRAMTALGVLFATVLLAVPGCAKKPEPLVAAAPPSTLDLVTQHGELRVCAGDSRPFSWRDPAGRWSGSDVDLAGGLASRLGVRLTLVPTTWNTMLDDLSGARCERAACHPSLAADFGAAYASRSRGRSSAS